MSKNKKIILIFLIIAFALMYLTHALIAFLLKNTSIDTNNFTISMLKIIGGAGPALAALVIVWKKYDKIEERNYWKKVFLFKVPVLWWIVAMLSPLLIGVAANFLYHGGWWYPDIKINNIAFLPLIFIMSIFAGGAEELGWRGILQDRLSHKINLLVIGIGIGILWGVWHAPMFMIEIFAHYENCFFTYILTTIMFSLIMTLVYYKTKSILLPILMHASLNTLGNFGFGIPFQQDNVLWIFIISICIVLSAVVYFSGNFPKKDYII